MTPDKGRAIYEFILKHEFSKVLELGFAHGVSTCYIAGALHELGRGKVVTVDNKSARARKPSIADLLHGSELVPFVDYHFEPRSYTWFLMRYLEHSLAPDIDFCYIDGAHTWDTDGFSFFLVDKCLKKGGWMLFDDLHWTYASSQAMQNKEFLDTILGDAQFLERLPAEEKETPQMLKVWELLVKNHPAYDRFVEEREWGFARKAVGATRSPPVVIQNRESILAYVERLMRRIHRRLGRG